MGTKILCRGQSEEVEVCLSGSEPVTTFCDPVLIMSPQWHVADCIFSSITYKYRRCVCFVFS